MITVFRILLFFFDFSSFPVAFAILLSLHFLFYTTSTKTGELLTYCIPTPTPPQ
jgi:hypothetical protein